jgi:glycosyltransferase involved in cell wall biosynthesis
MKIAILMPWIGIGGISQFTLDLGNYLLAHEYDVTVVTLYEQGARWGLLADIGIQAMHLPLRCQDSRVQHVVRLADYLARQQFDSAIVNIGIPNWAGYHCVSFLPDPMLALAVLQNDRPGVYQGASVHGDAWNIVVAVSPQVQRMAATRLPGKQVRLIPNGVRCPTAAELAQRAAWSTPLRLLFVGRLVDRHKGIYQLPGILRHCLAQDQAVTLTVVGDGQDRLGLERRFADEGVAERVEMVGALPNETVYAAMQAHHILLLPSHFEGDPMVLKEALANGCVPVASRLPGITDAVVRESVDALLAAPGDSLAFANQIAALADPLRWRTFSEAGIAHARAHLATAVMGRQYDSLLRELAAGGAPLAQPRHHGRWQRLGRYGWRDFVPSGPLDSFRRLRARFRRTVL